ncbi:MAG: protein-disulfide reductase DsbD family protein [Candidatus Pedobacter colombiensis]|uniref:Protein-disulfide reductase DsbD family protein n=1 Tax=Candidatus Pedobacter colombiensis TaxID=3121371 RepID=A0AAJ6B9L4_9SPHI|nr:protein-disulfide reductase DsbD domain-containing protein [Pedobacter sp.]WEK21586.1 MAG: protein-disulfide reductase DsbD family protein [Pedobacter sp.]
MRKLIIALLLLTSVQALKAQILHPVKWSYAAKKVSPTEAIVYLKATIDKGWHMYSQDIADGGPTKTVFTFAPSAQYALVGKTLESKPIVKFEKMFDMKVGYFENMAVFQQKVKLKSKKETSVKGTVSFGACNDTTCIPPEDVDFNVTIKS